jgi:hypothetical protein
VKKRLEQIEEGMVVDMPRPGLRHRLVFSLNIESGQAAPGRSAFFTPTFPPQILRQMGNAPGSAVAKSRTSRSYLTGQCQKRDGSRIGTSCGRGERSRA